MKRLATLTMLASIAAFGCGRESEPGGPGVANGTGTNGEHANGEHANGEHANGEHANGEHANGEGRVTDETRTFTLTVPGQAVDLDQGAQRELTLTIKRGENFDQRVELTFDAPTGITISPETATVPPGENSTKVRIAVAGTATTGTHEITVRGKPETGAAVSEPFEVQVNVPEENEPENDRNESESERSEPPPEQEAPEGTSPPLPG